MCQRCAVASVFGRDSWSERSLDKFFSVECSFSWFAAQRPKEDLHVGARNSERSLRGECSSDQIGHGTREDKSSLVLYQTRTKCGFLQIARNVVWNHRVSRLLGKECRERSRAAPMCDDAGQQ